MIDIQTVITDNKILADRYILRDGFVFTSITHPINVYDAIVIKHPKELVCSSPKIAGSLHNLEEHIEFINKYQIEKALIIAESIGFITECPTLKYLRIVPPDNIGNGFDYSPLYKLPSIKSLQCPTIYGFNDEFSTSIDCSQINGIEDIHVANTKYKNYSAIKTLKTLSLSNYKEQDLTNAFDGSQLDTLSVFQSKVKNLDGIQKSRNLQCLYLFGNRSLQDISALQTARKTLKALRIENCPKIDDFSVIGELENLELLELSGNNELPSLAILKTLKSLKTFIFSVNVRDGDLSLCTKLSYVYSEKNRRHYNLKDVDLPKGQYVRGNETIEQWRRIE